VEPRAGHMSVVEYVVEPVAEPAEARTTEELVHTVVHTVVRTVVDCMAELAVSSAQEVVQEEIEQLTVGVFAGDAEVATVEEQFEIDRFELDHTEQPGQDVVHIVWGQELSRRYKKGE
jgi:hypothetical protein